MSSVQLVRSNPPPPWPKSSLFVRKLLNGTVLDANYLPTLRQLGAYQGFFFFLFFVFFWALQKQIFPSKFSRKHSPRCENLPPKCCFTPTPLLLPEWSNRCPIHLKLVMTNQTSEFLSMANLRQISTWKIWFRPLPRIFHGKYASNSPDFEEFFFKSPDFYDKCW
jgi:hypothetical protein